MTILTLEYIRAHSRIDTNAEDSLLTLYGNAAEETIASYLNRGKTVNEMVSSLTEEYGAVPSAIMQAALMLVDVSYQYRAPVGPANAYVIPYTFDILVKPYMIL